MRCLLIPTTLFRAVLILISYYLLFLGIIILADRLFSFPKELLRKSYHFACSLSIIILLYIFPTWQSAAAVILLLFFAGFILLYLTARYMSFRLIRVDREGEKVRKELLFQVLNTVIMLVILVVLFRGVFDGRVHALNGVLIWGVGDALAAVVGGKYGRHRYKGRWFRDNKSLEGCAAFITGAAAVIYILWLSGLDYGSALHPVVFGLAVSSLGGAVEAVSSGEVDTLTVPISVSLFSYMLTLF